MCPQDHASDNQLDAAIWCRHLVPDGSVYAFLADHRHQLFPFELFADLTRQGGGHPSVPAEVIASVMVLQALEGLSDREAISALRRDIAWKVACGLRLDDEGFHPTVLVYWRARLRASPQPRRVFDAVGQVVEGTGVLAGRGRRVLDSTILENAVATQDTVTQLVAAIRRVRRLVPRAREVALTAHDYDQPGKPVCAWDDPQAKQALVTGLVNDALRVLAAVGEAELDAEQAEAVALLALVAGQDVEPAERPGTWRIARRVAKDRVISTVDPQARHTRKTSAHKRDGYNEDELRAARRRATTRSFQQSYRRWRPMVERSIAWLVADGCRRVPYRGIERNELWWSVRVAAVNLRRLGVLGLARQDGAWVLA